MPDLKFPPSVEIKRVIAAAERAGLLIASVEIHSRKIIISALDPTATEPAKQTYAAWKVAHSKE